MASSGCPAARHRLTACSSVSGYGGFTELAVALGVLAVGVLLWLYRTRVQDRR